MHECFVAIEQAVPSGEQVTLQPAFALMLTQHLHHTSVACEEFVILDFIRQPLSVGGFEHRFESVRECLVRAENAEIALLRVQLGDVAQKAAQDVGVAGTAESRRAHVERVVAKVRHAQVAQQDSTIGVWVRAHAPFPCRRQLCQFRAETPLLVEQLSGPVTAHPAFEERDVLGLARRNGQRYLVRPKRALDLHAINFLGSRPAFG